MAEFNIVALGDSIMWGQGLLERDKFVTKVSEWVATQPFGGARFEPRVSSYAHAGATVRATRRDQEKGEWQEVPEPSPSVSAQLDRASRECDCDAVDLLLLNGGINDISQFGIVVCNPYDPNGVEALVSETRTKLTCYMLPLIERALGTFRNANVVVVGYYPIISRKSDARQLARLIKHLPRAPGVSNVFDEFFEHLTDATIEVAIALEKDRMVEQCAAFAEAVRSVFSTAVASLASSGRIFYADVDFDENNSFATPDDSWLWFGNDDPLHAERLQKYAEQLRTNPLNPFAWPFHTPIASLCHPNRQGAAAYADSIRATLQHVPALYRRSAVGPHAPQPLRQARTFDKQSA